MFLNLLMLTGIAGAAVPLVLHLLSRAQYRTIDWGAMMFLGVTDQRQRQSTRLKQWILLAMRMAIVALLAMAMARPILSGFLQSLSPGSHVDAVIVIDCSASMAVEENGRQRIDLARRAAISVISQLTRGDRVAIVRADMPGQTTALSSDLQDVAQNTALLAVADTRADIAASLTQAANLLDAGDSLNREIYIVTDRQALNWSTLDDNFISVFQRRNSAEARPAKIFLVPVGGEENRNVAVEAFIAQTLPAVVKQPIELEVHVHNYGQETAADIPIAIADGQKELYRTTVTIPGGATSVVRSTVQFDAPRNVLLIASTRPDALPFDDRRYLSILVVPPLNVLIISGDEREGFFRKESDFLKLALAPFAGSGDQGADPTAVTVTTPAKWPRLDPRKNPVTILANVSSFTDAQASDLEQYVYSGGGLLITAGNLLQSDNYNTVLYRQGAGLLPGLLDDSMTSRATTPSGIIGIELSHPIFRFLRGRPDPVPSIAVNRHVPVQTVRPDASTLITLSNGGPLLMERSAGRGKVMLLTTSIDADWTTLPLSGFYLPLMQSTVRYLASSQLPTLNVRQGEPLVLNVEGVSEDKPPKLQRPDDTQDQMELLPSVLSSELRYAKTQRPGIYRLKLKVGSDNRQWSFVVQPPAEESDLSVYPSGRIAQIQSSLDMNVLDSNAAALASAVGKGRAGRELWLPMLLAALVLLGVETWYARRCSSIELDSEKEKSMAA